MSVKKEPPNVCHMFVCLNDGREKLKPRSKGSNPADGNSLNERAFGRGWSPQVRVSPCACTGLCGSEPEGFVYLRPIRHSNVSSYDTTTLLSAVDGILKSISSN